MAGLAPAMLSTSCSMQNPSAGSVIDSQGDREGRPIRINRRPSPSPSVGAGVDEDEGLGRLRRPRPVPLTDILPKHDHLPTPRATIKALPSPHRPPSPLRIAWPPA